jgi:hypothetical protein
MKEDLYEELKVKNLSSGTLITLEGNPFGCHLHKNAKKDEYTIYPESKKGKRIKIRITGKKIFHYKDCSRIKIKIDFADEDKTLDGWAYL